MNKIHPLPLTLIQPFAEIREPRRVLLVTSAPAWTAVRHQLRGLNIAAQVDVTQASLETWGAHLRQLRQSMPDVVYGVGGGLSADAAKYLAAQLQLPLVCLPTALSVDAFLTWASGIRRDGCVYYVETKPPDILVLDLVVLAQAPESIRAAGITDVLSIATGCWDWKYAEECGRNPTGMEFLPWAHDTAQTILNAALDCAPGAGEGDAEGLKTLYDCLALEVQLCNQIGHARPEEGSEHYFAYAVENELGSGLPHGDLVGPAILLMARLQGQDTAPLEKALKDCRVPLDRIPEEATERTLRILPDYCDRHALPFGIAHTLHGSSGRSIL